MIAATHNCGCPIPIQSLLDDGLIESLTQTITCPLQDKPCQKCNKKKSSKTEKLDLEQSPSDKNASEIVRKGQPYKEIEAIINNNRVIIRTHKEPIKEEYEPPCECIDQDIDVKKTESSLGKCDVSLDMAKGNLELGCIPKEDTCTTESFSERERFCHTMTLYPEADEDKKPRVENPIDREENPNIFILRIRKWSGSGDKKSKIDFEFRTPRPWRSQKAEVDTEK